MAFATFPSVKKYPVRAAPPPPIMSKPSLNQAGIISRLPSQKVVEGKKKCAPPRPPLPKQIIPLLRTIKALAPPIPLIAKQQTANLFTSVPPTSTLSSTNDLLINWDSPPTSPSIARSSSDGLSLQSFGSDSSSTTTAGLNNPPRSESGFESESDSGWSEFSANFSATATEASRTYVMPTIIRPTRSRAPMTTSISNSSHLAELEKLKTIPTTPRASVDMFDVEDGVSPAGNHSPPEPSIPPPVLQSWSPSDLAVDLFPSAEPKHQYESQQNLTTALALFDYTSSHSGDLNFREGDAIIITNRVNEEWYEGRIGSRDGIFPASFVELVPQKQESPASNEVSHRQSYEAVAMFPFQAETSQDLSLQEGDVLEVTETLGNGWLYGHRKGQPGRQGQFPEAFVQRTS